MRDGQNLADGSGPKRALDAATPDRPERPQVDVVVPFSGTPQALRRVLAQVSILRLRPGDTLVVVDNTPRRKRLERFDGDLPVLHAAGRPTPGFARNRGAAQGQADWLVFLDADAVPSEHLLDRYFDLAPGPRTALIGGGVLDEEIPPNGPPVARYRYIRETMCQQNTFNFGFWGFPSSTNIACRRVAFEAVGGFREDIRAAEDADLTYRFKAAGWEIERRESAVVVHLSGRTVRGLIKQRTLWGAGAEWLDRTYPGSFPSRRFSGFVWWAMRISIRGLIGSALRSDRDHALRSVFDPVAQLSFEFGRRLPNKRRSQRLMAFRRA